MKTVHQEIGLTVQRPGDKITVEMEKLAVFSLGHVTLSHLKATSYWAKVFSKAFIGERNVSVVLHETKRPTNKDRHGTYKKLVAELVERCDVRGDGWRRQSPIMLVWGLLPRLYLSRSWSLPLLYKCVRERRGRGKEGETDYERWRRSGENKVTLLWLLA